MPKLKVELAPAYDIVSTQPYLPKDTLALTLGESKEFPSGARLRKFVRQVTGKTEKAAAQVLEQVEAGVEAAISQARDYAKRRREAKGFVERLVAVMRAGVERLDA